MFHNYHLEMEDEETYESYEARRLEVLRESQHSNIFKAVLDVIETQARYHKELAFDCPSDEEKLKHMEKARTIDELYGILLTQTTKMTAADGNHQQRKVRLTRDAEMRVRDRSRALSTRQALRRAAQNSME